MAFFNTEDVSGGHNLTSLFSQAPAPIAVYKGRELRYVFINDAYSKIFNNRHILGKTIREAFPELEGQQFFEILEQVFDTGTPFFGNETPALIDVNNDGNIVTRYYNLVYTPYKNEANVIVGVMAFGHDVTDQVEIRNQERLSDLRFKNIVQQSSDPILILKGEDMVLDVANQALFKLWNVGEEAIGKTFLQILPEMKDQPFIDLLLDVYHNGETHYGYETAAYLERENAGKKIHYFNFIYQPYRELNNKITGVLVLATDVTEQVLTKQRFTQSELNFRNTILQAPVAMTVMKGETFVVEIANKRMCELWGKPEADSLNKPIIELLPEIKNQGLEEILQEVYKTGIPFKANERPVQLFRNGILQTTYLNFVYEPFRNGEGAVTGVIAVATEVTEQVLSRQKIEYAEDNARLAIDSADLGTYEINLPTGEMITSPRFKQIFGVENAFTRADFGAVIHPDDLESREKAFNESMKTGNLQFECRVIWQNGMQRWVRIKGKVLYDIEGKPERLIGVSQDITEHKIFAEELSLKVEERTRELQQANERLERSNEELEQFAFVSSHDLQEPLRKIQLFSNMILEQPEKEDAVKYLEKINSAAGRMAGLIRDLLEYSRLSHEGLHFVKVDLNSILTAVLSDFEVLISQKRAIIKADELPVLDAISLQMNQLLFNLVGNALKFTKKNVSPVITISAEKLSGEKLKEFKQLNSKKVYYRIIISDNGIGFNQEYADKIFTIFQTLNQKSSYGGYGIGLALCKKIVVTHSGYIYAKANENMGASFILILPCTQ